MLSKGVQGCFQIDIITTRRKTPINFNKCFSKNLYAVQFKWNILYLVYSPHFFDISPTVRYFFSWVPKKGVFKQNCCIGDLICIQSLLLPI